MLLIWLGIFFLSALGMFLFPVYAEQNRSIWPVILGAGIILNIVGSYKIKVFNTAFVNGESSFSKFKNFSSAIFLIPIILGIFTFRYPYNIPLYVLGSGIILLNTLRWKSFRSGCFGVLLSGLILTFQTASIIPYFKFAARYHQVNVFTPFFYGILKILGVPCAYSEGTLFVQTTQANMELVASWEKLGLFLFITYFIGAILFLYLAWENLFLLRIWKKIGVLFSVMIVYVTVRYVFLCLIFIEISKAEIFWQPLIAAGSFSPLPFIIWRFVRFNNCNPVDLSLTQSKNESNISLCESIQPATRKSSIINRQSFQGLAMFFFSFALITCFWFQDPGIQKKGRVLIDEFHSDWEWTNKEFDTEWFGIQSVYNYYCFGDYLNHFYAVDKLREEITEELLNNFDVFIVKTPTSPYTEKEIDIIERFVKNGGGLFLIGDHTNVFGITININPLAERFGYFYYYDATYDLIDSDLHFHENNRLFTHASVKNMPYFLFATSCSLHAPFLAEDTMIASNLKTMYLDYSRGGYFPDKNKVLNYTFGLFLQSSGVKYGKGRVLAFTDSTCFSNFYMHIPGKPEYALGSINWLNRTNQYDFLVKFVSLLVMGITSGFIVYSFITVKQVSRSRSVVKKFVRTLLFGALLGVSSGVIVCDILAGSFYTLPKEHTPMIKIGFEEKFCDFRIPSVKLLHNPSIDFQTFYVWPQRLGYVPTLFSLYDSLSDFDMVVMVNPQKYFTEKETSKIDEFLTNGGRLLIVDHPKGIKSTANQIIEKYGLKVDYAQFQEKANIYEGDNKIGILKSFAPVQGGQEVLQSKGKITFISTTKRGKGIIAVMACSDSFTNEEMGETEAVPDDHKHFLYKLEFWIFSSLINGEFESFSDFTVKKTD